MVTQGYSVTDTDGMTLRQLFHFANIASDRMEEQAKQMKAASRKR